MFKTARITGAGMGSCTGIHAEFESFFVYIIADPFHTMRKFFRVRNQIAVRITLFQTPAVIDNQIFISGFQISVFYHAVCHFTDHFFIDIPGKGVPGIPAHRRGQCDWFVHFIIHPFFLSDICSEMQYSLQYFYSPFVCL